MGCEGMEGVVVVPCELSLIGVVGSSSGHLLMFAGGNECGSGVYGMCVVCMKIRNRLLRCLGMVLFLLFVCFLHSGVVCLGCAEPCNL